MGKRYLLSIISLGIFILLFKSYLVLGVNNNIKINVIGKWKNNNNIQIHIDGNLKEKIYSGEISIECENLRVNDIILGEELDKKGIEKLSFNGVNNNNNQIHYFTCTGNVEGDEVNGTLFIIKATVLDDKMTVLDKDNINIKLYSNNNGKVSNVEYTFNDYIIKENKLKEYLIINYKNISIALSGAGLISIIYYLLNKKNNI